MVWSQLAVIGTPPIVTSDFLYIRFIGSSVVRSEQEIQMRDLIDKNLDHVLFIQKNQPRELSKDEVDDLVRIIKKEISRPRISLKLS